MSSEGENREDIEPMYRQRKSHTRSRTGCLTCRTRHTRCDEQRPTCAKCLTHGRTCEYGSASVPLRERRLRAKAEAAGEMQPWLAGPVIPSTATDADSFLEAFVSLSDTMPFKSSELWLYLWQKKDESAICIEPGNRLEVFKQVYHDPTAFRNSMLLAGIYYIWECGTIEPFGSTILHHKIEAIRIAGELLRDESKEGAAQCVRQISMLIIFEAMLNSPTTAGDHLNGLVTFTEVMESKGIFLADSDYIELEAANRCFVMSLGYFYPMLAGMKITRDGVLQHSPGILDAFRRVPSYLLTIPDGENFLPIPALPIIAHVRTLTRLCEETRAGKSLAPEQLKRLEHSKDMAHHELNQEINKAHTLSHPDDIWSSALERDPQRSCESSWISLCTSVFLYLNTMLVSWRAGPVKHVEMVRYLLLMLKVHIERDTGDLLTLGGMEQDLWLWMVFIGSFVANEMQRGSASGPLINDSHAKEGRRVQDLQVWFEDRVRTWANVTAMAGWADASSALQRISWPGIEPVNHKSRVLWHRIITAS